MHATSPRSTCLEKALLAVGVVFVAWLLACVTADRKDEPADDAFITYVYARNLAEGNGLRYNASDAEPTSGASSLSHVVLCAVAIDLGLDPLAFTRALGIALLLAIGLGFGLVGASIARAPPTAGCLAGLAVTLLVGLLPETALHLASGMDTLLFTAVHAGVAAWAALVVASEERSLGTVRTLTGFLALALAPLTRPEGGLLALAYLATIVFLGRERLGWSGSLRRVLPLALALLALLAALALWRWSYFGHVLSSAYYVKVSNGIFGSRGSLLPGASATARFALQRLLPGGLVVLAFAAAVRAPTEAVRRGFWLLIPATIVVFAYARAIHEMAAGFRYEYPLIAPFFGAAVVALCWLRRLSLAHFATTLACGSVALPLLASSPHTGLERWLAHPRSIAISWWPEHRPSNALARLGLDLGETALGQDATILLSGAGQVPWFSRLRAIDWIGLNYEPASGREPLSVRELWEHLDSLQPDLAFSILPSAAPGSTSAEEDPNFNCEHVRRTRRGRGSALFEHWDPARVDESFWREMVWLRESCEFAASYRLGDAWGEPWWVLVYVRKDSPHRALLAECFARSRRSDGPDEDLSAAFPVPPRRK
ncbi:MAG: hypothetical protein FJ298_14515 [Planctomycetes bacterium]|nr:hypothetical protein [Planctomycetota bacterium]